MYTRCRFWCASTFFNKWENREFCQTHTNSCSPVHCWHAGSLPTGSSFGTNWPAWRVPNLLSKCHNFAGHTVVRNIWLKPRFCLARCSRSINAYLYFLSCAFLCVFHLSISSRVNSSTMPTCPCVCVTCAILVLLLRRCVSCIVLAAPLFVSRVPFFRS